MTTLTIFPDEEMIDCGEQTVTLALSFKSIMVCETIMVDGEITPMPLIAGWILLQEMSPISVLGKTLYALTRDHHEGLTFDAIMGLMFGPHANRLAIGLRSLLGRHFDFTTPQKEKVKNPPKRRGPAKTS